jgi:hypothetical protein
MGQASSAELERFRRGLEADHELALSVGWRASELRRYTGPEGERVVVGRRCGSGFFELTDFPVGRRGEVWSVEKVYANGLCLGVLLDEYVYGPLYFDEVPLHVEGVEGSLDEDVDGLCDAAWAAR